MNKLVALLVVTSSTVAFARKRPPPAPVPDPSIKKTVDAFVGTWNCDDTMQVPGTKDPLKAKETISCKVTAAGRGAVCSDVTKMPGETVEGTFLIAYDLGSKAVHAFVVLSSGEVHDHKCDWKDDKTLDCGVYKGFTGTDPVTEEVKIATTAKTMEWTGTITAKDNSKVSFVASCKK